MAVSLNSGGGRRGLSYRAVRKRTPMSEINVTPLVDVMLVLLIIFMVTAPMLTSGVTVDLPEASSKSLPGQDEPLSVSVQKNGKIFLQQTEISLNEVAPKLDAIAKRKKETRIFVYGDKDVDYGRVMEVVSAIAAGGFTHVAFVTDSPANGKP